MGEPAAHDHGARPRRWLPGVGEDTSRIAAFSDGVFAVAITLLALDIRLPDVLAADDVTAAIFALWPKYQSYVTSFLVIGSFWMAHHRMFEFIKRYDPRLTWLNIITLMFVSLIPFPTDVVGEHRTHRSSVILYAVIVGTTSLLNWLMWRYATRGHRLVAPELPADVIRVFSLRLLIPALLFFFSIGVAFIDPGLALLTWILILPVSAMLRHQYSGSRFDSTIDA